jgi:hypothetical protein
MTLAYRVLILLPLVAGCASSTPPSEIAGRPADTSAPAELHRVQLPLEVKGTRFVVTFPKEFSRQEVAGDKGDMHGDVLLAAATRPGGYRIQVHYNSDVPVTNGQIQDFGGYLVSTAPRNLPSLRLGSSGVVTDTQVNVFFVSYMLVDGSAMGTMLIRSLSGNPLNVTVQGPQTPDAEPILAAATKHMLEVLSAGEP